MDEGTMADASELSNVAAIEQQTPEVENDEPKTLEELDADAIEGDGNADEGQEPEVEMVEVERNGKRYSVPKELHGELMMNADYTRKTQETAALKKSLQEQEQQIIERSKATDDELQTRAALMWLDGQLDQYNQVDWNRFQQDDPLSAQAEWIKYQQMKDAKAKTAGDLEAAHRARSEQVEKDISTRLQETADYAQKNIKGWSDALDARITDFAVTELGFETQQLRRAMNPQLYRMMHLAYMGQQTLSKLDAKPAATPQAKPLTTIASKAAPAARKDLGSMSMDEYAAHRNRQLSQSR